MVSLPPPISTTAAGRIGNQFDSCVRRITTTFTAQHFESAKTVALASQLSMLKEFHHSRTQPPCCVSAQVWPR